VARDGEDDGECCVPILASLNIARRSTDGQVGMIGNGFPGLLERAQRGEHPALAELYRDLAPVVLGYLRANRAPDPEDVASEVFVAMVKSLGRFSGEENQFRSWVLTITHRRMVDAVRARQRRKEDATERIHLDRYAPSVRSGEVLALQRLDAQGALDAIDDLTDDQRAVLLLRVLADLSIEDVAALLGKPVTAVKALQRRANAAVARRVATERAEEQA
jgi:RNA polymerase sigma factor (sigma-70 family)